MSILYTYEKKKNPQDKSAEAKVYLVSRARGRVEMEEVLEMVCQDSTIDPYEAQLALHRTLNKVMELLCMGFTVHMDKWGYFNVQIQSEGSETEKEATADKVQNKRLIFYPGPKVRKTIKDVKLELYKP